MDIKLAIRYVPFTTSKDLIAKGRERYLGDVARAVRGYHSQTDEQVSTARQLQQIEATMDLTQGTAATPVLEVKRDEAKANLATDSAHALSEWPSVRESWSGDEYVYQVRGRDIRQPLVLESCLERKLLRLCCHPRRTTVKF